MTPLLLPRLRLDQSRIARHPAKRKYLCMGRRWGKTVLGGAIGVAIANAGGRVAWVALTYKNSRPMWRWVEQVCNPHLKNGVDVSKSERVVTFPSSGSLGVYSADNPDSILGEAFHLVVVDESARVPEQTIQDTIEPTLADYDGTLIEITTPKGKNRFFVAWSNAYGDQTGYSKAWTAPTSSNPNPNIQKAFIRAKDYVTDRSYRQEWLAEFVEDGALFRNVRKLCVLESDSPSNHQGHRIVIGTDPARETDYWVNSAYCATCNREVELDRYNGVSWTLARGRLAAMIQRWSAEQCLMEQNSIGSPNVEELQKEGLPIVPFDTTAKSKPPLIQSLVLSFEQLDGQWLKDGNGILELEAFEEKHTATGHPVYSAPDGMHDDTVIARALARRAAMQPNWYATSI